MRATRFGVINRNRPGMLVLEPIVGPLHRLFWREFCLFFFWKSRNESSDLGIVRVHDRDVSVIPRFLHSVDRELEPAVSKPLVSRPASTSLNIQALQVRGASG